MKATLATFAAPLALAAVLVAGACDKQAYVPTGPPPPPPGTAEPIVTRVELAGPDTVAPGATAQFTLVATYSDGTTRDVTTEASWATNSPFALSVTRAGLATGVRTGEATLSASYATRSSAIAVVVVPAGTFRVTGRITEAAAPAVPVVSARVQVVESSRSLSDATTDVDGRYRLYGVPAQSEIRVTATGYLEHKRPVQLSAHSALDVPLELSGPRPDLSGRYRLSISAAGCSGGPALPASLMERTYEATVTQVGYRVLVSLSGATMRVNGIGRGDRFSGTVTPAGATFELAQFEPFYYYYPPESHPDVAERLPDGSFFVPSGQATTTHSSDRGGLVGSLRGQLNHLSAGFRRDSRMWVVAGRTYWDSRSSDPIGEPDIGQGPWSKVQSPAFVVRGDSPGRPGLVWLDQAEARGRDAAPLHEPWTLDPGPWT